MMRKWYLRYEWHRSTYRGWPYAEDTMQSVRGPFKTKEGAKRVARKCEAGNTILEIVYWTEAEGTIGMDGRVIAMPQTTEKGLVI